MTSDYSFLDPSIDPRLAADIDAAERNELVAYKDSLGNWTCGRGHLLPPAAPGRSWEGFSVIQSTSDRWFCQDLLDAIALAKKWPEYQKCDTRARQNALCEIAFNLSGRWHAFVHARAAIEAQNWQTVHDELLHSLWATQVGVGHYPDGKPKRATRIANQFLTGRYPDEQTGPA
jgi:GH24 family phage-related lysozyme (muramidase)